MFYENAEFQLASFHTKNKNNNALNQNQLNGKENLFPINPKHRRERLILNIVLLGEKNIDKLKLIKQFVQNIFLTKKSNNSLDIIYQRDDQSNEKKLHLIFHHTDLSSSNLISICHHADCLLFVYDISNQISFNHFTDYCLPLILNHHHEYICSYSLIGIKNKKSRQVSHHQVDLLVKKFQLFHYEITSRSNFGELLKELLDNYFQAKLDKNGLFNMIKRKMKNLNQLCDLYRSCLL